VVQSSARIYKIYVAIVAAVLIGGSVYTSYTRIDMFPFAAFMMYSSVQDSRDFYLLKSFCHKKDDSIIAVSEFDTWAQEGDYFQAIDLAASLPLTPDNLQRCQRDISRLLTDLSVEGCKKITLKRYYWKQFSGPVALTPDKEEFMCEVWTNDGH
jgi:hypothetical protein